MIEDLWYKNAIIYCLDVKTFQDADGNGVGDFRGLIQRLEYLAGLGATCLWLLPFQPSPNRDNGYDISDHYGIHPGVGSPGDFVEFSRTARSRGFRLLFDLVVNHTSDRHPWFQSARRSPASPYRDWYVWSKQKPKDAAQGMAFPGEQDTTWSRDPLAKQYFFHRFYDFQPDLHTLNPEVWREVHRIAGYWLSQGISGFRMDAVPFVIQEKGPGSRHREHYELLTDLRQFIQWRAGEAVILAEANVPPRYAPDFFGAAGGRVQMMFNFQVNQAAFYALAAADARPLARALERTRLAQPTCQWVQFLRSNDDLDLGRLTPAQRDRVHSEFAPDPAGRIFGRGIRRRLAPMMNGDRRRLELAWSLVFSLPGTPLIRSGDEIGMGDDLSLSGRNAARTPMQWSDDRNGGFSPARKTYFPVVSEGPFSYRRVNVTAQRRDPGSLLHWMQRLIGRRKQCPEIGWGEYRVLKTSSNAALALRYDWQGRAAVLVHNFSPKALTLEVDAGPSRNGRLSDMLRDDDSRASRGRHRIQLEGYGYRWYRA